MTNRRSVIVGSGSYLPSQVIPNSHFLENTFFDAKGNRIETPCEEIAAKLTSITEIEERRYVTDDLMASDIGYFAARDALDSSGIDKETLDYIIVAHNFGDVKFDNRRSDFMSPLASKIKNRLEIKNPNCNVYDVIVGCPGWLTGMIQSDYFLRSGDATRAMVIGTETISRVCDPHDRDSMIFADGAGATIIEAKEGDAGILSHASRADTQYAYTLKMGESYNPDYGSNELFVKMDGRRLYSYAISTAPEAIGAAINKAGLHLKDIKKVFIHQANGKMDAVILERLYQYYEMEEIPENVMPMTISWLGNSSVATLPTMYDLIIKNKMKDHELKSGDNVVFASMGAGMTINAFVYRMP